MKLAVLVLAVSILCTLNSHAAGSKDQTDEERMNSSWEDLEKEEPHATRASLNFADKPELAVAFFKTKLAPLRISEKEINKLIEELGNDDDSIWKPAFEKLQYSDPRLTVDLKTLMSNVLDHQPRSRLVEVLCDLEPGSLSSCTIGFRSTKEPDGYNFTGGIDGATFWAEARVSRLDGHWTLKRKWTRAVRAIAILEHIGTPDAIAILKDMSTGHPDASPTRAAHEALDALQKL